MPETPASPGQPVWVTKHHVCIDIAGVLRWSDRDLVALFKDEAGQKRSPAYIRDWLRLQQAHGKRVLPTSADCEGFSDQTGCPGHRVLLNPP